MLQAHLENLLDVLILERIVALLAVPANLDEVLLSEDAELVGYGALLHTDDVRDTADAQLALKQRAKTASPIRVSGTPSFRAEIAVHLPVPFWPAVSRM